MSIDTDQYQRRLKFQLVDQDQLLVEVDKLVDAHPDAIYTKAVDEVSCLYDAGSAGGGTGCLIGQGLQALGYSLADLDVGVCSVAQLCGYLPLEEGSAGHLLTLYQEGQDHSIPWGEVRRLARNWLADENRTAFTDLLDEWIWAHKEVVVQ